MTSLLMPASSGRPGPGRDADPIRIERFDLREGDFVVALHHDLATQLAEILDEVVGERVVVIDDQNLYSSVARLIASTMAIALLTVS